MVLPFYSRKQKSVALYQRKTKKTTLIHVSYIQFIEYQSSKYKKEFWNLALLEQGKATTVCQWFWNPVWAGKLEGVHE